MLCVIYTVIFGLLILCRLICCFHKCHLSMLRRIGIGSALTIVTVYMLSIITVNSQTVKRVYIAPFVVSLHILSKILAILHFLHCAHQSPVLTTCYERTTDWILLCYSFWSGWSF